MRTKSTRLRGVAGRGGGCARLHMYRKAQCQIFTAHPAFPYRQRQLNVNLHCNLKSEIWSLATWTYEGMWHFPHHCRYVCAVLPLHIPGVCSLASAFLCPLSPFVPAFQQPLLPVGDHHPAARLHVAAAAQRTLTSVRCARQNEWRQRKVAHENTEIDCVAVTASVQQERL